MWRKVGTIKPELEHLKQLFEHLKELLKHVAQSWNN